MGIDMSKVHAAKAENAKALSGGSYHTLDKGKNRVRILPPYKVQDQQGNQHIVQSVDDLAKGMGAPWAEGWFHYQLGPGGKASVICVNKMHGQHCAICTALDKLKSSPNAADRAKHDECKAKIRIFYNIAVYPRVPGSEDNFDETKADIRILAVGRQIHQDVLGLLSDPEFGDITDPNLGLNLTIEKTGKGTKEDTKYTVRTAMKQTPINPAWIGEMKNLDELLNSPTPEEIEQHSQELMLGSSSMDQHPGAFPQQQTLPQQPAYQQPPQYQQPVQQYQQPAAPPQYQQPPIPPAPPQQMQQQYAPPAAPPQYQQPPIPPAPPQAPYNPNNGQPH